MEAEVSATLEACTCVFLTTFCTLMLISCIVLVTSSIADAACTLTFADSSEALAICPEPLATCDALSRTCRTRVPNPGVMRVKAKALGLGGERGGTDTDNWLSAIAAETAAISFKWTIILLKF